MTAATALMHNHTGGFALQREFRHNVCRDVSKSLHVAADYSGHSSTSSSLPSLHPKDATERQPMSFGPNGRKFPELPIDELDESGLAKRIANALAVDFGNLKAANKEVANTSGASIKSAENWTGGYNPPSLLYFLRLYAKSPALQAEVRRLTAMETDHDPDFQRDLSALINQLQRMQA
jgi:hypothetical protein